MPRARGIGRRDEREPRGGRRARRRHPDRSHALRMSSASVRSGPIAILPRNRPGAEPCFAGTANRGVHRIVWCSDDVNESAIPTHSAAGAHRSARWRRATAVLTVTGRRLRARPGRALLVSAGVTVAVAFLTGVAGGSAVSEDLALRHALAALPPAERALRVAWSGQTRRVATRALDRSAQRAAGSLTDEPLTRSVELNDVRFGAGLVKLAAVSGLDRYVHLRSGPAAAGLHAGALRGRPDRRHVAAPRGRVRHPAGRRGAGDAHVARAVRRRRARDAAHRRRHPARAGAALIERARPRIAATAAAVLAQLRLDGCLRPGQRPRLGRRPPARDGGPGGGAPDGCQRAVRHARRPTTRSRRRARRGARRHGASCSSAARPRCSCSPSPA